MVRLKDIFSFIIFISILKFQFLMVRLKEQRTVSERVFFKISIPYGAIKSLSAYLLTPVTTSFQFLMVRLKVYQLPYLLHLFLKYFNSLWCD